MAAPDTILQFANDPDPEARRAELLAFVGPRPEGFLHLYDCLVRTHGNTPLNRFGRSITYNGFSAPAFFLGPVWFFYRKMWVWGALYVVAMVALAAFPVTGRAGIGLAVAMALLARWAYLEHAARRINTLRHAAPEDRDAFLHTLALAGGVSKVAGWTSGVVFAVAIVLAVVQRLP